MTQAVAPDAVLAHVEDGIGLAAEARHLGYL
jgi:hypothetical protein